MPKLKDPYIPELRTDLREHFKLEQQLYILHGPIRILEDTIMSTIVGIQTTESLDNMKDTIKAYYSKMGPYLVLLKYVKMNRLMHQITTGEMNEIDFILETGQQFKWTINHG